MSCNGSKIFRTLCSLGCFVTKVTSTQSRHLPSKVVFNDLIFVRNFKKSTFEKLNLIKLSPGRECTLEECKNVNPPNKLSDDPSKLVRTVAWNTSRRDTNYNPLDCTRNTIPCYR